jgi:hypothetical protein
MVPLCPLLRGPTNEQSSRVYIKKVDFRQNIVEQTRRGTAAKNVKRWRRAAPAGRSSKSRTPPENAAVVVQVDDQGGGLPITDLRTPRLSMMEPSGSCLMTYCFS